MALLVRPVGAGDLRAMRRHTMLASQRANFKRLGSAGTSSFSAFQATFSAHAGGPVQEETVGVITIEDVLEEVGWSGVPAQ